MRQFVFPRARHVELLERVKAIPGCETEECDPFMLVLPDSTWWNFLCREAASVALVSLSEHCAAPEDLFVSVSPDCRRLWRLRRVLGDFRLSRRISALMTELEGELVLD
jgi:hypothetical protein